MAEDLNTIFADAKTKAENASNIAFQWANGDINTVIITESGELPSLAKFQFDTVGAGSFSEFEVDLSSGDVTLTAQQLQDNSYFYTTGNAVPRQVNIPATPKIFYFENRGSSTVTLVRDSVEFILPANLTFILYTDGSLAGFYNVTSDTVKQVVVASSPTVTDDKDAGYSVNSSWIDTSVVPSEYFICTDNTVGAAEWVKLSFTLDEVTAVGVSYDNTASGLVSLNVQDAIDEVDTNFENHLSDSVDAHDASAISFAPTGNLSSTDTQAAIEELDLEKEPADPTILKDADIGVTVQAYDLDTAKLDITQTFTAAQRGGETSLTDGATITPDFSANNRFEIASLAGNRTLANPTSLAAGQSGRITVIQDATGSRVLAYGALYLNTPTLSTTALAVDILPYETVDIGGTVYVLFGSPLKNVTGV